VRLPPGVAEETPSVLVTPRSTCGWATTADVAELLAALSSGIPAGPVAVAVFDSVPVNPDDSVPVMVYVAESPASRLALVVNEPDPLAVAQLDPLDATHVHVAEVRAAGNVSETVTAAVPDDGYGPPFVATTVYVTVWPGTTGLGATDLVTLTSMHSDPDFAPGTSDSVDDDVTVPAVPLPAP